jgi:hypothetical protein
MLKEIGGALGLGFVARNSAPGKVVGSGFEEATKSGVFGVVPAAFARSQSVSTSSSTYASDTHARLTREQYDDYRARFLPYLSKLDSGISNPAQAKANMTQSINQQFSQGLSQAQGMTDRNLSRFGMAQTDREKQSGSHLGLINSTKNQTQLTNQMNNAIDERTDALVSGGALSGGR